MQVMAACAYSWCKNFGTRVFNNRRFASQVVLQNIRLLTTMTDFLDKVVDANIDNHGRFKYILINVSDKNTKRCKFIVRGLTQAQWHADIFDAVTSEVRNIDPDLRLECVGGGRIEHDSTEKTLKVYGYSQGFGKADHEVTCDILKEKYPDYTITCSDEGY